MGFYNDRILPHVINLSMRNRDLCPYRERVLSHAHGRVLEIGVGSGLNLPLYRSQVREIVGLEHSPKLVAMARRMADGLEVPVTLIAGSAEALPVDAASVDTVVTTWTLCSIRDVARALEEARRVLRPGGQLLFVEHGRAPEVRIQKWQDRLTPLWKRIGGGCHLNRPIATLIERAGFSIAELSEGYMKGPDVATYFYEGRATPP